MFLEHACIGRNFLPPSFFAAKTIAEALSYLESHHFSLQCYLYHLQTTLFYGGGDFVVRLQRKNHRKCSKSFGRHCTLMQSKVQNREQYKEIAVLVRKVLSVGFIKFDTLHNGCSTAMFPSSKLKFYLLKNSKALVVPRKVFFIDFVYFTIVCLLYQKYWLSRFQTRCIRNACCQLANFKPILTELFSQGSVFILHQAFMPEF